MTPPTYLTKRGPIWYVQVPVPKPRQQAIGAKTLERSLRTRDEAVALRLRHSVIAEFQARIEGAHEGPSGESPEALLSLAQDLRKGVEAGTVHPIDADASFDESVDTYLAKEAKRSGVNDEGHARIPSQALSTVRRAHKALSGALRATLGYQRDAYLKETKGRLTAQTIDDKTRRLEAFCKWFGEDRDCAEVTRKKAGQYVAEVILERTQKDPSGAEVALSPTTMKKEISDLRAWFDWLLVRGEIELNPFDRMSATIKTSTRGKAGARRPWTAKELSKVLHGVKPEDPLWSLTVIAAYTGMRREEVAELKLSSVEGSVLKVEEGKTAAAVRRVPVHPALSPLIKNLEKTSTDDYLIPGLLRGGPDKKRAWYVGKRFGRAIRQLGIEDESLDFHALRGTVITQLESAGVLESTIQLIVGHKRQGMTLGTYSAGVPDKVKREAISKVTYGKTLDAYVAEAGARVRVKASARARSRK